MKNYFFLIKILFLVILGIFSSCQKEDQPNMDVTPNLVKVFFNVKDPVSIEELPMRGSAEITKTYMFNIYQLNPNTNSYDHYAHGTFDNLNELNINLLKGEKYMIHAAMFINYFEKYNLNIEGDNLNSRLTAPENKFIYKSSFIYDLDSNYYFLSGKNGSWRIAPDVDSYHAKVNIGPIVEGQQITLELNRSVFGIDINVTGMTEGKINYSLYIPRYYNYSQPEGTIEYPSSSVSEVFTLMDPFGSSYSANINISYVDSKGKTTSLFSKEEYTFPKNVRTIFNINLSKKNPNQVTNSMNVTVNETDLTSVTNNIDCEILN